MLNLPPLDVDPAKVNLAALPFGLQDLARAIGLSAAMKLVDRYPGVRIYVPAKPTDQHMVATLIGSDAMQQLCDRYGPGPLQIPKLDRILQQLKNRMVIELRETGYSARDIAIALNYTERHVLRIASENGVDQNLDLFGNDS